jgi:hypothetical protein
VERRAREAPAAQRRRVAAAGVAVRVGGGGGVHGALGVELEGVHDPGHLPGEEERAGARARGERHLDERHRLRVGLEERVAARAGGQLERAELGHDAADLVQRLERRGVHGGGVRRAARAKHDLDAEERAVARGRRGGCAGRERDRHRAA